MLEIVIPSSELFDERTNEFIKTKEQKVQLEHSLVSISKWESKWHKSFLSKTPKTKEETLDYIRCMTLTQNVDKNVYLNISDNNMRMISEYIEDPMTAVHFVDEESEGKSKKSITSEVIYSWMIALNIPFECQKWHLNRLLTLIRVCNVKNNSKKKMNKRDIMNRNAKLNAARRKEHNTKG